MVVNTFYNSIYLIYWREFDNIFFTSNNKVIIMNKTLITFFTVLFCLTSSLGWSLEYKDLVKRDGLYYKQYTEVPFNGKVEGLIQGSIRNGKRDGYWIFYHDNGQLDAKGNYRNGKLEGSWVYYHDNGQLQYKVQ